MLRPYLDLYRDTLNPQVPAEVRLHEHTDGPAPELRRELAARCPDAAFPSERDGPPPRTHRTFSNWALGGAANGAQHVGFSDGPRTDVVEEAVIRLADDGIGRAHVFVAREREQPGEHGVSSPRDAQCAGQHDRRLQLAELIHLRRAGQLAKAVSDDDRRRDFLPERIAGMRQNRGDPGID